MDVLIIQSIGQIKYKIDNDDGIIKSDGDGVIIKRGIYHTPIIEEPRVTLSLLLVMEFDEQLELGHFTLPERKCRVCGVMKDLIDGYYLVRKNKNIKSSYSYECKDCTIKREKSRKKPKIKDWEYPDW